MSAGALPGLGGLIGTELGSHAASYGERDAILYALALGAGADRTELVYEEQLKVLPTFALTLGLWAVEAVAVAAGYDRTNTLHVGQELTVVRPLPRSADVRSTAAVEAVWDKGSAALVVVRVRSELFDARYTIFVPGAGGFGGDRGPSGGPAAPDRPPDVRARAETTPNQAALYRLTGDPHPIHINPAVARAAGFERPILHGLASLGCTALAISDALGREPTELTELSVRFAAPVYPGAAIDVSCWSDDRGTLFAATADGTDVLKGGVARFGPVAAN
jgi:acyl dehydratase